MTIEEWISAHVFCRFVGGPLYRGAGKHLADASYRCWAVYPEHYVFALDIDGPAPWARLCECRPTPEGDIIVFDESWLTREVDDDGNPIGWDLSVGLE